MKKFGLLASAGCFCALLAFSCKNVSLDRSDSEYKTLEVKKRDKMLSRTYTAIIQGRQSVEIRPQVSGTITEVNINEGEKVKKGQSLFVIGQVPYKAALQTAQANVKSTEAAVATARMTADSKQELCDEQVISLGNGSYGR